MSGGYGDIVSISYDSDKTTNIDLQNRGFLIGFETSYDFVYMQYYYGIGQKHNMVLKLSNDILVFDSHSKYFSGITRYRSQYDKPSSVWKDEYHDDTLPSVNQFYNKTSLGFMLTGSIGFFTPVVYRSIYYQNKKPKEGMGIGLMPSFAGVYSSLTADETLIPEAENDFYPVSSGNYSGNDYLGFGGDIALYIVQSKKNYYGGLSLALPIYYYEQGSIQYKSSETNYNGVPSRNIPFELFFGYTGAEIYYKAFYKFFLYDGFYLDNSETVSLSKVDLELTLAIGLFL